MRHKKRVWKNSVKVSIIPTIHDRDCDHFVMNSTTEIDLVSSIAVEIDKI